MARLYYGGLLRCNSELYLGKSVGSLIAQVFFGVG
jgi:hypothetical protein